MVDNTNIHTQLATMIQRIDELESRASLRIWFQTIALALILRTGINLFPSGTPTRFGKSAHLLAHLSVTKASARLCLKFCIRFGGNTSFVQ